MATTKTAKGPKRQRASGAKPTRKRAEVEHRKPAETTAETAPARALMLRTCNADLTAYGGFQWPVVASFDRRQSDRWHGIERVPPRRSRAVVRRAVAHVSMPTSATPPQIRSTAARDGQCHRLELLLNGRTQPPRRTER